MVRRRHALVDPDDSDDDCGPGPMSPNTKKKEDQKRIMGEDLGQATVDHITTSDYGSRRVPNVRIVPKSDRQGTEEAKIASEHAAKTNSWRTWGDTDEAKATSAGWEALAGGADGNSHRYRAQQERLDRERDLGRQLDLKDTYDDRPLRTGAGRGHGPATGTRHSQVKNSIFQSGSSPKKSSKMSFRGIQDRPWPPPALEGTPAFPTSTGASLTAAALQEVTSGPALSKHKSSTATKLSPGSSTKNVQTGLAMGQTPKGTSKIASSPVSRVGSLPSRQAYTGFLSSDSSAFVSSATKYFATFSNTQQAQQENTNVSSVVAAQETQPSTKDTSQQLPTAARDNDAIRKIPVSEFAFPVNAALAPPQMSTHTDGAPSPEALSGFSASAKSHAPLSGQSSIHEEQAQNSNAVTCDLIGLGIQDIDDGLAQKQADCSSPNNVAGLASDGGSIMDSPIIDNMNNDVLVAGKGKVVIINGIRYVPESDLLALKLSLTTAITKPDITINTDHVLESKDIVSAIASSSPPSKTQQSSASDPPSSSNISQSVVKANPFNPREPIVQGGAKIPILPSTTDNENQKDMEPLTLDQAIVAALRSERSTSSSIPIPSPAPVEAAAPVPPASNVSSKPRTSTSANAIISKWAPIAPSPDPSVTPSVGSVTVDERKNTSALQPKSTNGGSIHASSTQGVNSGPLPKPSGTLQPPVPTPGHLSTSPLIGDRRAFGHLSPLAAAGLQHASPPGRPAPKRKFHQPGPGYTLLLADLERSSARSTVQAGAPALEMSIPSQQSAAEDSDDSEL